MLFGEMIKMALSSLGANKLRSALTMLGITIGVFSVISVMTAIGALQYSVENGISFLGSNIFQFGKYPANISASGDVQEKISATGTTLPISKALHYYRLIGRRRREICLKSFGYEVKGQAVFNGIKTTPSLLIVGTNKSFLTANAHTLGYGRNLNDEDVELSRRVIVVGKIVEKRLFPHETPIGKVIRVSGTRTRLSASSQRKGRRSVKARTTWFLMPITRFFEDYGEARPHGQHRDASVHARYVQSDVRSRDRRHADRTRLTPDQPNDFEIYSNGLAQSAFVNVAGYVRVGAFVISLIAPGRGRNRHQ